MFGARHQTKAPDSTEMVEEDLSIYLWTHFGIENQETVAAIRARVLGEERGTNGLREALSLLNTARQYLEDDPPPFWATNALLQEISVREGISINDLVAELKSQAA
jgi:hypothetical protein